MYNMSGFKEKYTQLFLVSKKRENSKYETIKVAKQKLSHFYYSEKFPCRISEFLKILNSLQNFEKQLKVLHLQVIQHKITLLTPNLESKNPFWRSS